MSTDGNHPTEVLIPVEQDTIPFCGHELVAVLLEDGRIAVVLRWVCESLRLNQQSQLRSIRGRTALAVGLLDVRVQTEGGPQTMPALTLKVLPGWLFVIDERRVRTEARDDLVHFQLECVDVLADHFARKHLPALPAPVSADPAVTAIVEQIADLTAVTNLLREHLAALLTLPGQVQAITEQVGHVAAVVEALAERQGTTETQVAQIAERTQRLTPAHARAVQEQVNRMVRATAHLPPPAQLTYSIIYGRLKHRFRAGSYSEIADERFDEVMAFLRSELRKVTSGETPEQERLL